MTMTERAAAMRIPTKTTPEDLETGWCVRDRILTYGNRVFMAGYYYTGTGANWFGAVYEFLYDGETTCEDFIGLQEISGVEFEDEGHAIAWCLQQN